MFIQTRPQLALQKWEPAGQVILEIFLTIKLKACLLYTSDAADE